MKAYSKSLMKYEGLGVCYVIEIGWRSLEIRNISTCSSCHECDVWWFRGRPWLVGWGFLWLASLGGCPRLASLGPGLFAFYMLQCEALEGSCLPLKWPCFPFWCYALGLVFRLLSLIYIYIYADIFSVNVDA